ncbi:hypothetical protein H257_07854 [Aphanomyces astaci]|uniref:Uncharacterized protein n=1 Tax=Aphanomyces astaci TaxID=112090 RepID=W4GJN6_APHAT|nr:hypothetical protein H257_07854 [Aphanomyces astaci]ETV79118.1 hypothetical protein H257_07854 [Aphanomyces astaci]|eukprot:XP_009831837.1 hypothetical protein H257_07854 [Aphanomyces astaci]
MSAPLLIDDLSALKRENKEFQKALTKAVTNLKDLSHYSEYIHRPLEEAKDSPSLPHRHPIPVRDGGRSRDGDQPLTIQMKAAQAMHEEYEALIADLSSEVRQLRIELSRREASAAKDATTIANLSTQLSASTSEIQARSSALSECMDRIQDLETTVASQTRAILTKETERKQLDADAVDMRRQLRAADTSAQELTMLQASLDQERTTRKKAEKRVVDLDAKVKVLHGQCAVLEQMHATVDAQHRKDMQLVVEQLDEAKSMLGRVQVDMSDRIARRDTRISRLKVAVLDLQQEKTQWQAQVDRFHKALRSATTADDRIHVERVACKRMLDEAKMAAAEDAARCHRLEKELSDLRTELALADEARRVQAQRHAQALLGKEAEAAYVWEKFVTQQAAS